MRNAIRYCICGDPLLSEAFVRAWGPEEKVLSFVAHLYTEGRIELHAALPEVKLLTYAKQLSKCVGVEYWASVEV